jgi:C1A family cysteine protease
MLTVDLCDCGWLRDPPDHRDYTPQRSRVQRALERLSAPKPPRPSIVDWREYCLPVQDQQDLRTSSAHACIGLFQYFERRATGQVITPSRLFLHANALRLSGGDGIRGGAGLRVTLKAAVKFGLPPERFWPYVPAALKRVPEPYLYAFNAEYHDVRYVRVDAVTQSGVRTLQTVKSLLAGGFACALGFGVPSSLTEDPEIPFPTRFDSIRTGQAVTVVGYNDDMRIRSSRGALLIRNSWGPKWGQDGYGWLPYRYVTDNLAADVWTALRAKWLRSGEFRNPF